MEKKVDSETHEPKEFQPEVALLDNLVMLNRAVSSSDSKLLSRVWRNTTAIRQNITPLGLKNTLNKIQNNAEAISDLEKMIPEIEEVGEVEKYKKKITLDIETIMYFKVLICNVLFQNNVVDAVLDHLNAMIEESKKLNKRSLDSVTAKMLQLLALILEKQNRLSEFDAHFLRMFQTACVREDEICQATLANIVLRSLIQQRKFEQADQFVSFGKKFPVTASHGQYVRFLFYCGWIAAVQLNYTDALNKLTQALRKAPTTHAEGFRLEITKFRSVVQLLMGDIPEKSGFIGVTEENPLYAYSQLTKAVKDGDVLMFSQVMEQFESGFASDGTLNLVTRLRHNVIKAGLRHISLSYSRISLQDICNRLHLQSAEDAQFLCSKAIADGVIEGVLDEENACLCSREVVDVYGSTAPQKTLKQRIDFCFAVRNEAIKSMSFPRKKVDVQEDDIEDEEQLEKIAEDIQKSLEEDDEGEEE
eukprot:TRINITY_DN9736_c0_g1_i1.p1 TRINITY_DN9736_c0_g1~~TRINITY_DN9736_c0_g1_i1.p1  ORF type:complete len:475 (-),score=149.81 TRINITY_DN9736_c0_g1_i1:186-1610(-)